MAALANVMGSLGESPRCDPSPRVGHRVQNQRAHVVHTLVSKLPSMSVRQRQALQRNKKYNFELARERMYAREAQVMIKVAAAERRAHAAERIQRAWRKSRGYIHVPWQYFLKRIDDPDDSDSDELVDFLI